MTGDSGYIANAKLALTDKNPPYFKSDDWYDLLEYAWNGFLILLAAAAVISLIWLCDWAYKRNMYSYRGMWKLLDSLSGLIFCAAIAGVYVLSDMLSGEPFLKLAVEVIPDIDGGIIYIVVFCAYLLALYYVWALGIRYLVHFGANWTIILTTFLVFALLTIYAFGKCLNNTDGLWGILAFLAVPFVSFIGFMLTYNFVRFYRCPRCHATGYQEVQNLGTEDLGTTTSHAIETETKKSLYYTETTKHDIYTTRQHNRTYMRCNNCGQEWDVYTSYETGTQRKFNSYDKTRN